MNIYTLIFWGLCLVDAVCSYGQQIIVQPYLQNASPNSMTIMWESSNCDPGYVHWGLSTSCVNTTAATTLNSQGYACIFTAQLIGLQAETNYFYRVSTGSVSSAIYSFKTPSLQTSEASVNIVAMSDMQKDSRNPDKFHQITNQGIIDYIAATYAGSLHEHLQMILIPGDLVDNGNNHNEWVQDFFFFFSNLFRHVPVYLVLGNHEKDAAYFFDYFDLPQNGTPNYLEHWWFKDISNIRILGLDSNDDYQVAEQLEWLDSLLNLTASDTLIDFVFAQLHHPHHSELWPVGNTNFTGDVIDLMERFSEASGKPSIHFFGHTHGYSRGQSKEHSHLMVNVASAGGNIDYWEEYTQIDYPEYSVSDDDYGYVFVEVNAGENPRFTLKRFSLGDECTTKSNVLTDSITIKLNNVLPEPPTAVYPLLGALVSPDICRLEGSSFVDLDADGHGASQWQVSSDCQDFSNPLNDTWVQHENWYKGVNTQENKLLSAVDIYNLLPDEHYCWRVRYRDKSLGWSPWSVPVSFATDTIFENWKLYPNPVHQRSTLNIPLPEDILLTINIFDAAGKLLRSHKNRTAPVFQLYKKELTKGIYYLQVMQAANRLRMIKFVVVDDG